MKFEPHLLFLLLMIAQGSFGLKKTATPIKILVMREAGRQV
jgi:hypothetical protein